jgi:hypothetical protein
VETFYRSYIKRKLLDDAFSQKLAVMSGTYANMNHDQDSIRKALEGIEEDFQSRVKFIQAGDGGAMAEETFEIDPEDPFWKAMYRGQKKWDPKTPEEWARDAEKEPKHPMAPEIEIDQSG